MTLCYYRYKLNKEETVDAEITAMMPLQRTCDAENQVRNKFSNGPLRAQSNEEFFQSILRRSGRRHMPGICWYPAKSTGHAVKQGGTADSGK